MPPSDTPRSSQLDEFIEHPMGPGLTGAEAPGQSVHPQAPQPGPEPEGVGAQGRASGQPLDSHKHARGEKLGSEIAAARIDLGDSVLREPGMVGSRGVAGSGPTAGDVGGANAAGFGASLGQRDPAPTSIPPVAPVAAESNEQADVRLAQARAQGGRPDLAAPDPTRAQGEAGGLSDTDGL